MPGTLPVLDTWQHLVSAMHSHNLTTYCIIPLKLLPVLEHTASAVYCYVQSLHHILLMTACATVQLEVLWVLLLCGAVLTVSSGQSGPSQERLPSLPTRVSSVIVKAAIVFQRPCICTFTGALSQCAL